MSADESQTGGPEVSQARAEIQGGRSQSAVDRLRRLVQQSPEDGPSHMLLGVALMQSGNLPAAREAFSRSTDLQPSSATAHYNFAVFLAHTGELEDAIVEADTALYLAPRHEGAQKLRATLAGRIRDKHNRASLDGRMPGLAKPTVAQGDLKPWERLPCQSCGALNHITSRTCCRCSVLLSQDKPVIPME